jgi:agmatine/peptidylarginine deiminase
LGCRSLASAQPQVFADIVDATRGNLTVIALVNNSEEQIAAAQELTHRAVLPESVRFLLTPHDTMWTRDYGPLTVVGGDGSAVMVDAQYGPTDRPNDDLVPVVIANHMGLGVVTSPIRIDGGNVLSNGHDICLTTHGLALDNLEIGNHREAVREEVAQLTGTQQVLFLDPLAGESTGHVDMFATFTSQDTIVVGQFDTHDDAVNAQILDRNAERLACVHTREGRLQVERVPMPPHDDDIWRSYTNVVYANQVVLVPVYPETDPDGSNAALALYTRLMPGRKVVGINAEDLSVLGGALHCVTMNMARISGISGQFLTNPLPEPVRFPDLRVGFRSGDAGRHLLAR